jgi:hypothetical protein
VDPETEPVGRQISIPITYPAQFFVICVPSVSPPEVYEALRTDFKDWLQASEVDDALKFTCNNTKLVIDPFSAKDMDDFYKMVDESELSHDEENRCRNAKIVFPIHADGTEGQSFFAPFWTAILAGHFWSHEMQSILIDPYQKRSYDAQCEFWRWQCDGIPLTQSFLAVKGFPDGNDRFKMITNGMQRFGLPELELLDVPQEFGPDGAYLLRGIAQYMWNTIELTVPEQSAILLDEDLDISSACCEADKFARYEIGGSIFPVGLRPVESGTNQTTDGPRLEVTPTNEFALSDQWFGAIMGPLRDQRLSLENCT